MVKSAAMLDSAGRGLELEITGGSVIMLDSEGRGLELGVTVVADVMPRHGGLELEVAGGTIGNVVFWAGHSASNWTGNLCRGYAIPNDRQFKGAPCICQQFDEIPHV